APVLRGWSTVGIGPGAQRSQWSVWLEGSRTQPSELDVGGEAGAVAGLEAQLAEAAAPDPTPALVLGLEPSYGSGFSTDIQL
ncbi:MAG: hypothetical protein ACKOGI_04360, partial [Vulcanococcus sp.]